MTTPTADQEATARVDSDLPWRSARHEPFAPETIIAGLHRIAGILGSGGMGEVLPRRGHQARSERGAEVSAGARLARDPILLGPRAMSPLTVIDRAGSISPLQLIESACGPVENWN